MQRRRVSAARAPALAAKVAAPLASIAAGRADPDSACGTRHYWLAVDTAAASCLPCRRRAHGAANAEDGRPRCSGALRWNLGALCHLPRLRRRGLACGSSCLLALAACCSWEPWLLPASQPRSARVVAPQARNFAVMTGVNAGVAAFMKRWRGKDDINNQLVCESGRGRVGAEVGIWQSWCSRSACIGARGPLQLRHEPARQDGTRCALL